jgi:hypothetical protein
MSIEKKDFHENKLPENKNNDEAVQKLKQEIQRELAFFIGSETVYKVYPNLRITEGVKFLAEKAESFWLIDIIYSYQSLQKVRKEPFQVYELTVDTSTPIKKAKMVCTDGNENILQTQEIPLTTFPLDSIKLYFTDGVLLLPSEY